MGAFFTNVQLYLGEGDRTRILSSLEGILTKHAKNVGFAPAGKKEDADLRIAYSTDADRPWISLYDQGTESQDPRAMDRLLAFLTRELQSSAVGVTVHDSDILLLQLYEEGQLVDRHCVAPDYYSHSAEDREGEMRRGAPEAWEKILSEGTTLSELERAFGMQKGIFVEDEVLGELIRLFGWNSRAARLGFEYLEEEKHPGLVMHRFKAVAASFTPSESAPALQSYGYPPPLEAAVGRPFATSFMFYNSGRATRGLRVILWGKAVNDGALGVEGTRLRLHGGYMTDPSRSTDGTSFWEKVGGFEQVKARTGENILVADFAELEVPGGIVQVPGPSAYGQERKTREVLDRGRLYVEVTGSFRAAASEPLYLAVQLHERSDPQGDIVHSIATAIVAAPRLPLTAVLEENAHNALVQHQRLLALAHPRTLTALVCFDPADGPAAERVVAAGAEWAELLRGRYQGGSRELAIAWMQDAARKSTTKALDKLETGRISGTIADATVEGGCCVLTLISATVGDPVTIKDVLELSFSSGLIFRAAPAAPAIGRAAEASTLCVWMDTLVFPESARAAARAFMEGLVEGIMAGTGGIQAFVTSWDFHPTSLEGYFSTPYEEACGLPWGGYVHSSGWCKRYLRAVAETLWLGPELRSRVDAGALEAVADTQRHGDSLRIGVRPGGDLTELERVLLPILPTKEVGSRAYPTWW